MPGMTSSSNSLKPGDHLYLIDGSGFIFRAYFQSTNQDAKYNSRSDGLPVGAVRLFCNMMWGLVKGKTEGPKPTHLAVIFDYSSKTFRSEFYPEYKAHRPEPPADMRPQFGLIRQATRAFNLPCIEKENFEADDIIATYAREAVEAGATCRIITSDKDLMQLIGNGVDLFDPGKEKPVGEAEVLEKFGVTPDKVVDVQALAGDSSDNVPGVPGIGVKTGAELINTYGDLETLLARASEIKQNKRRENLIEHAELARISKRLVTLDKHVPDLAPVGSFAVDVPRAAELIGFLKAMEFTTITKTIATALDADISAIEPVAVEVKHWPPEGGLPEVPATQSSFRRKPEATSSEIISNGGTVSDTNQIDPAAEMEAYLRAIPVVHSDYETVSTIESLKRWIAVAEDQGFCAVDTETDSLDAMQANIVGFSLATAPGKACYIPLAHQGQGDGLFGSGLVEGQVNRDAALALLKPLLADASVLKIGQNLKYDMLLLKRYGITMSTLR